MIVPFFKRVHPDLVFRSLMHHLLAVAAGVPAVSLFLWRW